MIFRSLFSSVCAGCNQPGEVLCHRCRFSLASAPAQLGDDGVRAALPFEGVARQVVLGLKYHNRRGAAAHLAKLMVARLHPGQVDVVTWAPTAPTRVRTRGYDQAELLARAVARQLGVPCRRLLYRAHGTQQTGHTRAERLHGPSFRARPARRDVRVLLVDDVITTGATLRAAAEALRHAGVADVVCLAAAATPPREARAARHQAPVQVRPVQSSPAQRRTVATASLGSSSTSTPRMPSASAADTFDTTSSRNAVRPASAPNLARAS
jgi:predicted amidophosphoribosyltransferase